MCPDFLCNCASLEIALKLVCQYYSLVHSLFVADKMLI